MDQLKIKGKPNPIRFTILRPLSAGFSSAPYKNPMGGGGKADLKALKLSQLGSVEEDDTTGGGVAKTIPAMTMWGYCKIEGQNGDKGQRMEDQKWILACGL